jgi:hypothetical protein
MSERSNPCIKFGEVIDWPNPDSRLERKANASGTAIRRFVTYKIIIIFHSDSARRKPAENA